MRTFTVRVLGPSVLALALSACNDGPLPSEAPQPPIDPPPDAGMVQPPPDLSTAADAAPFPVDPAEPLPGLTPLGPWVTIASPGFGMHFLSPADLRIQAATLDPSSGTFAMPRKIDFLLDGRVVGTAARDGSKIGLYVVRVPGVPAGDHLLQAVSSNEDGTRTMSQEVFIKVDERRADARPVRTLSADLVLSGAADLILEGSDAARLLIVGGGHRIRSTPGWSGRLVLRRCDVQGLGSDKLPAIDVAAAGTGAVTIEDTVFDAAGLVQLALADRASATIRNNEFRANALFPVVEQPSTSSPAFRAVGESSGPKVFSGNRIGLSFALFERTGGWLIGGDRDEDVNMAWGVRVGLHVINAHDVILRGNYSHDNCGPGLSQCLNFEILDSRNTLVEHNVIRSSAWPLRGVDGEARYNLILDSGHSWLQAPASGAKIHHNIFAQVSGPVRYAPEQGVFLYNSQGVELYNNTFDGGGAAMAWYGNVLSIASGTVLRSLRSNAFVRFASPENPPIIGGAFLERLVSPGPARLGYADYNLFHSPGNAHKISYAVSVAGRAPGQPGFGEHDKGLSGAGIDARFAQVAPLPYPIRQGTLWARRGGLSQVLAAYRAYYLPGAASPLIDAGDPQDGGGNDIGAVGAGAAHGADRFGTFGR